ncbi:MAG: DUF748 domain-containing protein [Thermodesulfovibrionales bacterium]|nr:DUF748 domain-containing protein [Thermodesulfovibrionales bacterium]
MSNLKKYFLIFVCSWLVIATIVTFALPPLIKPYLVSKLSEELNRKVFIRDISINPFELSVSLKSATLYDSNTDEEFLKFDEIYINLESISLFKQALVVKNFNIKNPSIKVVRNKDKTYNFSDLLNKTDKTDKDKQTLFSINNINISNGYIVFLDKPFNKTHRIENLNINIPFISNISADANVVLTPLLEGRFNGKEFRFTGQTKPFTKSLETDFNLKIKALDIPQLLDYLPIQLPIKLQKALLDTDLKIKYTQFADREPLIDVKGNLILNSVSINFPDDSKWFDFDTLSLSILSTDVTKKEFHIDSVSLLKPVTYQQRGKDGNFKIPIFSESKGDKKQDTNPPVKLKIDKISLKDGTVYFSDKSMAKPFNTTVNAIDLSIYDFSTEGNTTSKLELSLETAFKETVIMKADIGISPFYIKGNSQIKNIGLKHYLPFYEDKVLFELKSGFTDISLDFDIKDNKKILLSDMVIDLKNLKLKKPSEDKHLLYIPNLSIKAASLDMENKTFNLGNIDTRGAEFNLIRNKDKRLNYEDLIVSKSEDTTSHKIETKNKPPDKEWVLKLSTLKISNYKLTFFDNSLDEPFTANLKNINITGKELSTNKNSRGKIAASSRLNDGGIVTIDGSIGINPLTTDFKLKIINLALDDFQPYVQEMANLDIYEGYLSLKGQCHFSSVDNSIKGSFRGDSSISDFKSKDDDGEDLLKWKSLYIGIVDVKVFPVIMSIDEIALTDFYSKIIINKDATLNLQRLIKKDKVDETKSTPALDQSSHKIAVSDKNKDSFIKIGKITLQGGHINFTDNHINPPYNANLLEIGGRVSGMMSMENSSADVDLKGRLENYAPLDITGKINPLLKDLFVDLKIDFKNIDLTPLTPYSGKYVGYTIEKGKLSLQMKYLISERKLDATNNIFLDQFTFGQSVDSPEATRLPVRLAVALLKNRKGEIDLDIPLSGSLDDPKFSLGGVIWKAILNILLKVATAPFALLGSFLGGSDEASYLEFDYGTDIITVDGAKKLDNIAKALTERPGIRIELQGHYDVDKDKEGLKREILNRKIRLAKAKDTKTSIETVTINTEEYSKYLKLAYKDEKFPKPRNIIGLVKELPDTEIEKLILTHIEVSENDLKKLAGDRAMRIKDYLVTNGKIEPTRIFLIEPSDSVKNEKAKRSRVDFKLSA